MFTSVMNNLKIGYKFSKESVTMVFSGEFNKQDTLAKIKESYGFLKQVGIKFVQRGMEIKFTKKDLLDNYHCIMQKTSVFAQEVKAISTQACVETKGQAVDLYESVLNRIKEKERQIRKQR